MADESTQLALRLPHEPQPVDHAAIIRQPSMTRAIVLCSELAGLKNDKDQARAIDIDPTTWSLIKKGERAFDHDKFELMFDEFRNEIPLLWLLYRRGYDLHSLRKRETETERLLRLEREEKEKLRAENEILRSVIAGGR